jgi:hypothetical protein
VPDQADQLDRLKAALTNRYRIERELGSGGMATVDLAEDRKCRVFSDGAERGRGVRFSETRNEPRNGLSNPWNSEMTFQQDS